MESVWDYPRPPRVEPVEKHIVVRFDGEVIAETSRALRVLETSHPPTYYLPREDVRTEWLVPSDRRSLCEWKGSATWFTLRSPRREAKDVAWSYPHPLPGFEPLEGYFAFYAGPMDSVTIDGEEVTPQPGGFYGGWITSDLAGPFKGIPGSSAW